MIWSWVFANQENKDFLVPHMQWESENIEMTSKETFVVYTVFLKFSSKQEEWEACHIILKGDKNK